MEINAIKEKKWMKKINCSKNAENNKAAGVSGIIGEMLKNRHGFFMQWLCDLFIGCVPLCLVIGRMLFQVCWFRNSIWKKVKLEL